MFHTRTERPYLHSWLRRTRRQLAPSGRLSEMALILSREDGGTREYWAAFLREILDEAVVPSMDLLTRVDGMLAKPSQQNASGGQRGLF